VASHRDITSVQPRIWSGELRSTDGGSNHTTYRFGGEIEVVTAKEMRSTAEARKLELILKRKKNPRLALFALKSFKAFK
jgi:hypothetical protein